MWFIIVTLRNLFWALCSTGTVMMLLISISTPKWLLGPRREIEIYNKTITYRDSVGLYNRCNWVRNIVIEKFENNCGIYARNFSQISSDAWKASIIFLGAAILILGVATLMATLSFCKQICFRKSLLNLAGVLQAIAGILLVIVLVAYPAGWGSSRIERLCYPDNPNAKAFQIGQCSMGSSFYLGIAGCLCSFLCSFLAIQADKSVFSSKVQDEILEGKHLICLV